MEEKAQYQALMSEIIAKQAVILGPEIAILKARNVADLSINDEGNVMDITGEPAQALQKLIDEYIALSGEIVRNVLGPIFGRYPELKIKMDK